MVDDAKRAEALRQLIRQHDRLYYIEARPEISDYEYDLLMLELQKLEHDNPDLKTPDSPTVKVGGGLLDGFRTLTHGIPMLSIGNTYSEPELVDFDRKVKDFLGYPQTETISYVGELKIDGVAIHIEYDEAGMLACAITRGDGIIGDDVTENIKTIRNLPLRIETPPSRSLFHSKKLIVRGEVFMRRKGFDELNRQRNESSMHLFANPRNATAGSLKLLDTSLVRKRPLEIFLYSVLNARELQIPSHFECLHFLKAAGLPTSGEARLLNGISEALKFVREWDERRKTLDFDVDGIVLKVDALDLQEKLGTTSKSPRWVIAYKYQPEVAVTRILDITLQVGRTGRVTPVAELEPVLLSGSTVKRATLHNEEEIARKDIRSGDYVEIEKGGEIIPKVVRILPEKRSTQSQPFTMPQTCPSCSSPLKKTPGEVGFFCENIQCPSQLRRKIEHFASRQAMNIDGLGISLVEQLVRENLIADFGDLYYLDQQKLEALERMGKKSAENLVSEIEKSKSNPLHRLVYGLGIRHVGLTAARILSSNFGSIDAMKHASAEQIESLEGVGPKIAQSVVNFFSFPSNLDVLNKLEKAGINMKTGAEKPPAKTVDTDKEVHAHNFSGKSFVLTGTLASYTRDQAKELIEAKGGKVSSSVSQKTSFVIVGENPGSKYSKALELGITILNESEFIRLAAG